MFGGDEDEDEGCVEEGAGVGRAPGRGGGVERAEGVVGGGEGGEEVGLGDGDVWAGGEEGCVRGVKLDGDGGVAVGVEEGGELGGGVGGFHVSAIGGSCDMLCFEL